MKSTDVKFGLVNEYIDTRRTKIEAVSKLIVKTYKDEKDKNNQKNTTYKKSYNILIYQGSRCNQNTFWDFNELIILAHAVYGWMPTILAICSDDEEDVDAPSFRDDTKDRIKKAVAGLSSFNISSPNFFDEKTFNELITVAKFTNNSFVGASKFLHFIYPDQFAIWDSKIFGILNQELANDDKTNGFFATQNANCMRNFIGYQWAMQAARARLNEEVELRAIESVLFDMAN